MLLEFFLLNLCVLLVIMGRTPEIFYKPFKELFLNDLLPLFSIFNLSWGLIILNIGDPNYYVSSTFRKKLNYLTLNTFIFIGLISTLAVFLKVDYFNRTVILLPIFLFSSFSLLLFSLLTTANARKGEQAADSNILLVGGASQSRQVLDFARKLQPMGYATVGFLNNHTKGISIDVEEYKVLGNVKDLPSILDSKKIDEIFISGTSLQQEEIQTVIDVADNRGVRVNLIPETPSLEGNHFKTSHLNGYPIFKHRQTPLDNFNNFLLKRIFDTLFSLAVLIGLSPLFIIIAILIKLEGRGPVFYKPVRKGEAGGTFRCYKFRTMSVCDDPVNGTQSTVVNDPRITRIGKYLRKLDLDELPQFYNVLKGEMSVIGPRPHRVNLQNDFRKIVNDYMVRHYVRPGISGWAQVNGWRGPTSTVIQKKERIRCDLWYIENWSFWLDLKIIFLTIFSKKTRKNAF